MTTQQKPTVIIACCFFYSLAALASILSPALTAFGEMWPDASTTLVQQIATLPNLVAVPTAIIAGALAGKKVKYKTLVTLACLLMAAGGVIPFFYHESLYFVLGCRCIFGIGYGICFALMGTVIVQLFTGDQQAKVLGWGASSLSAVNIVLPTLAGYAVNANVNYVWLLFLISALCMVAVMLWLPEPEHAEAEAVNRADVEQAAKPKITGAGWAVIIVFGITIIAYYPLFLGISTAVIGEGLGTASQAGLILSVASLGSFVAGLVFAKYYGATKSLALPIGAICVAVGLALLAFGGLVLMFVGAFICGFGHAGLIMSSVYRVLGEILEGGAVASANGMVGAFSNLGGFLAPFWMAAVAAVAGTANPRFAFAAGAIVLVLCAVVILPIVKKAYANKVA